MLIENMKMAFSAIRINKMRSFLTMLGIIIGIGSVISIVSIGDTMRSMFADLYKEVGLTQAYISIGYWLEEVRQSDYFTLDDMERIRDVFGEEIAYMDCSSGVSANAQNGRTQVKFNYEGIDWNYQDVQPVNIVYGRYLNEADVKGRKKNVVMDTDSAMLLFGVENAVGKTFRTTIYGTTDEYTVAGVYRKEISPFQAMMMGTSEGGTALIPYTLLAWPNDYFYSIRVFAKDDVNLDVFFGQLKSYIGRLKGRNPEDYYMQTAVEEMGMMDSMMGGLSAAGGGIADISPAGRRNWNYEYYAGFCNRADEGNRNPKKSGSQNPGYSDSVPYRICYIVSLRRNYWNSSGRGTCIGRRNGSRRNSGDPSVCSGDGSGLFCPGRRIFWNLSCLQGSKKGSH